MDIKKSIRNIFENIIAYLLVVVVGGVAVVLTFLAQLPLYQLLLFLLAAIGVTLWVINQYAILKERRKRQLTKLTDRELENMIREWINIPAWSVQPQPLEKGISFAYTVNHQKLLVFLFKQAKEPIIILSTKLPMHSKKNCVI